MRRVVPLLVLPVVLVATACDTAEEQQLKVIIDRMDQAIALRDLTVKTLDDRKKELERIESIWSDLQKRNDVSSLPEKLSVSPGQLKLTASDAEQHLARHRYELSGDGDPASVFSELAMANLIAYSVDKFALKDGHWTATLTVPELKLTRTMVPPWAPPELPPHQWNAFGAKELRARIEAQVARYQALGQTLKAQNFADGDRKLQAEKHDLEQALKLVDALTKVMPSFVPPEFTLFGPDKPLAAGEVEVASDVITADGVLASGADRKTIADAIGKDVLLSESNGTLHWQRPLRVH